MVSVMESRGWAPIDGGAESCVCDSPKMHVVADVGGVGHLSRVKYGFEASKRGEQGSQGSE